MIKNLNKVIFVGLMDEWINEKKSGPLKILWMNRLTDEWMNLSFASDSQMIKNLNKVIFSE